MTTAAWSMKDILIIEPFYGGSHAQLIDLLLLDNEIGRRVQLYTLPAKKWHWRARTSALYLSQVIEQSTQYRLLFCSSVLNLAELISLRPDLARLTKVVYFHENQLIYPVQRHLDRDFHYGYSQILTAMVAEEVIFNSEYNKESFLDSISHHLKLIPDHRPKHLAKQIRPKCKVMYFPLTFIDDPDDTTVPSGNESQNNFSHRSSLNETTDKDSPSTGQFSSQSDSVVHSETSAMLTMCSDNLPVLLDGRHDERSPEVMLERREECERNSFELERGNKSSNCDRQNSSKFRNGYSSDDMENAERIPNIPQFKQTILKNADPLLHIVWPHRWEHDKGPDAFFDALFQLQAHGHDFKVSVIGQTFSQIPDIFEIAHTRLGEKIFAWGYQSREDFIKILKSAHVVVSTADHEFFGVSMLEATYYGCFPLCPKRLVYPEIYPGECLYSTQAQLVKHLKQFCQRPDKIKTPLDKINMTQFSWDSLKGDYRLLLLRGTQTF